MRDCIPNVWPMIFSWWPAYRALDDYYHTHTPSTFRLVQWFPSNTNTYYVIFFACQDFSTVIPYGVFHSLWVSIRLQYSADDCNLQIILELVFSGAAGRNQGQKKIRKYDHWKRRGKSVV